MSSFTPVNDEYSAGGGMGDLDSFGGSGKGGYQSELSL